MNNDLISREVLKKAIETYDKFAYLPDGKLCPFRDLEYSEMYVPYIHFDDVIKAIDNAPTALFPLTVQIIDEVTDKDIETLKQLMKDYKPQILNLETERLPGELAEKLKDRIEESVCKYCQMNKHCELCEISRVFQIITLTAEEQKGGAE